jgi:hypothetical protein
MVRPSSLKSLSPRPVASLLTILSCFTVDHAEADCAWVLWTKHESIMAYQSNTEESTWLELERAVPTLADHRRRGSPVPRNGS